MEICTTVEELKEKHHSKISMRLFSLGWHTPEDLEEQEQEFYVWCLKRKVLAEFDPEKSEFETYIYNHLSWCSNNQKRSKVDSCFRHTPVEQVEVTVDGHDAATEIASQIESIASIFASDKRMYRIFCMTAMGYKQVEIANELGITRARVSQLRSEMKKKIKKWKSKNASSSF